MKIKNVEEKTKLSSKTIRFYEEKGLLTVSRNSSGYRDYTDENVEELLKIKLFRRCGLSIQDIIDVQKGQMSLEDILYDKISEFDKRNFEISYQKELCLKTIKAKGNYQKLYATVAELESEEVQKFYEELTDVSQPSLGKQVIWTIVLLGPLLNAYLFLSEEKYERLWILLPFIFFSAIVLTASWQNFLKKYKFYRESWKKGIMHTLLLMLVVIIGIVFMIFLMIIFVFLQTCIFLNDAAFMISSQRIFFLCFLFIGLECFLVFLSFLSRISNDPHYQDYDFIIPFIKKHKFMFMAVNLFFLYIGIMNITVFTDQHIIHYSTFYPLGIVYQYDDVKKVETGFYEHGMLMLREQGEFYYKITMQDGKVISIEDTQTISEYEEDTYTELVILDDMIMQYHPLKKGDDRFADYLLMDQIYIDRFLSIVHNQ